MDDFDKIAKRLDARMAHVEEQLEAVVHEMRTTTARVDGMSAEFRGMRTDLAEFSGMVKGFGTGYQQQLADLTKRVEVLEQRGQ